MAITRKIAEREIRQCLTGHEDIRDLLRTGGSEGVRRFTQVLSSCVDKLNAEAGLSGPAAALVTSGVMLGALRSMLLFREGNISAATEVTFTLWNAFSTSESMARPRAAARILAKQEEELELARVFPFVVFEEAIASQKTLSGRDMLRRLLTCLELSFENVGRILNVPGETVRRWERGISRMPSDALATLELVDHALTRLTKLFLPQRLPEVVRRKADLFEGARALDWILQGRIMEVVDRYERALAYQA